MKRWLLALLLCLPQVARADDTVVIKGVRYHKGLRVGPKKTHGYTHLQLTADGLSDSYDAQAMGVATPVKGATGQGSCGDCWAWSRTAALESAAILSGLWTSAVNLSEEDTTDNASDEAGCGGGEMDFNYELKYGVTTTLKCPFQGGNGSCNSSHDVKGLKMAFIGGSGGPTDDDLRAAIYQFGDVAVTVAAGGGFDTDGSSDRMTSCGGRGIDHMVSLVGWRKAPDGGWEFKMKNSWGTSWGAKGIAYMKRGCNEIATGSESAMVISVDGPGPKPLLDLQLPIEIVAKAGVEVPIMVPDLPINYSVKWSSGEVGTMVWEHPAATTLYTLTATDDKGNQTSATVQVIVN